MEDVVRTQDNVILHYSTFDVIMIIKANISVALSQNIAAIY